MNLASWKIYSMSTQSKTQAVRQGKNGGYSISVKSEMERDEISMPKIVQMTVSRVFNRPQVVVEKSSQFLLSASFGL